MAHIKDFSTIELLRVANTRIKDGDFRFDDFNEIQQICSELAKEMEVQALPIDNSLNSTLKLEHLAKVWNKYTPAEIEAALPE